tara:strand:+ start:5009 stop:5401 length:393 start_codon:yes stop_codon:yes gene_type:complete
MKANGKELDTECVRIHFTQRPKNVRRGDICIIRTGTRSKTVFVRGMSDAKSGGIQLDYETRDKLNVVVGTEYEFEIEPARWCQKLTWQLKASNPAVRTSAQISLISLALGLISLALGLISLALGLISFFH